MLFLIELPAEILLQIFGLVDSKQLRGYLGNQLVCKRWLRLVRTVIFSFDGLVNHGMGSNKHGEFDITYNQAESTVAMNITEAESDSPLFVPVPGEWRAIVNPERKPTQFRHHAYGLLRRMIGPICQRQPKKFIVRLLLEELDFAAQQEAERSLTLWKLTRGLPKTLRSITIDNGGEPAVGFASKQHHLCGLFLDKQRFPFLSTLVLRLPYICSEIFHTNKTEYPPLETIVLNLNLAIRPIMSSTQCKCCHTKDLASSELTNQLEQAGLDALPFLPELRTFHIIATDVVDSVIGYGGRMIRTGSSITQVVDNGQISHRWRYRCKVLDWSDVDAFDHGNTPRVEV